MTTTAVLSGIALFAFVVGGLIALRALHRSKRAIVKSDDLPGH